MEVRGMCVGCAWDVRGMCVGTCGVGKARRDAERRKSGS